MMSEAKWGIGTVLADSWEIFQKHPGTLIGAVLIPAGVSMLFSSVGEIASMVFQGSGLKSNSPELAFVGMGIAFTMQILVSLINVFFILGTQQIYLKAAQGEETTIGDLFSQGAVYPSGIASLFCFTLAIGFGSLLCLVPGIILYLGLQFHHLIIVDKRVSFIEALSESWRLADGEKMDLFIWSIVCFGVTMAGVLTCCVGLFVAVPVCGVGTTLIYLNLNARKNQ
jgi:uncharacterized membrane protein